MKLLQTLKRPILAASLCGTLLWGGTALAEEPGRTDMDAFREAMTMSAAAKDNRVLREQVIFFLPDLKANLDFQAVSHKHTDLRAGGTLEFVSTDAKGDTVSNSIPFYFDQSGKSMTLYFRAGTEWLQFKAPTISAAAVDLLGTPTGDDLRRMLSLAKDVQVLRESEGQRTMWIDLDEKALDGMINALFEENKDEKLTEGDRAFRDSLVKYLKKALERTDAWCVWTVDKRDWQTITFSINLSDIVQEAAKAALEDQGDSLHPGVQMVLDSLAYYSELKAYTTYLNPDTKSSIEIPAEARNGKVVEDVIPDGK